MTRRDNGLPGGEWQRLADLAPPLADHVLEILRDEGIAAYAAPATGDTAYGATKAHPRPTDQVFVGRAQVERARAVLDELLPTLDAEHDADERTSTSLADTVSTDDEVWAGIVAAYAAPPAEPVGRWSVAEDVTISTVPTAAPDTGADGDRPEDTPAVDDTASVSGPATGFEDISAELDDAKANAATPAGPADDPHDHYQPPPPPPLPEGDPVTRMAWVGVLGGPLFLILAAVLGWGVGGFVGFCAVLAFVGGFITLVTRLGNDREDDGDDGAVV